MKKPFQTSGWNISLGKAPCEVYSLFHKRRKLKQYGVVNIDIYIF